MSEMNSAYDWYRLTQVRGLGPKRLNMIHRHMEDCGLPISEIFDLDWIRFHDLFPKIDKAIFDALEDVEEAPTVSDYRRLQDKNISVIHLGDERYPRLLPQRMGDSAPPLLYCHGYLSLLQSSGVSIVGARNASSQSLALTASLAAQLADNGMNVISGYAKGVDTAAHVGALVSGGTTTVVLSSGIFDFRAKREFEGTEWKKNTLAISQFQPDEKWSARNAMTRNKLICALSEAMIIMEAGDERDEQGRMSGTFDAGKTALEMGVPLFVIDPRILDSAPRGNTKLIDLGAEAIDSESAILAIQYRLDPPVALASQRNEQVPLFPF
ncbi:MAG TPA: DNA-processing protein DprA [Ktedonobacteraceae bacterium]|nr:DNA-processing protein DprA [Ktedonobacteraceae bacterium]